MPGTWRHLQIFQVNQWNYIPYKQTKSPQNYRSNWQKFEKKPDASQFHNFLLIKSYCFSQSKSTQCLKNDKEFSLCLMQCVSHRQHLNLKQKQLSTKHSGEAEKSLRAGFPQRQHSYNSETVRLRGWETHEGSYCTSAGQLLGLSLEKTTSRNIYLSPRGAAWCRSLIYFTLLSNCTSENTAKQRFLYIKCLKIRKPTVESCFCYRVGNTELKYFCELQTN